MTGSGLKEIYKLFVNNITVSRARIFIALKSTETRAYVMLSKKILNTPLKKKRVKIATKQ